MLSSADFGDNYALRGSANSQPMSAAVQGWRLNLSLWLLLAATNVIDVLGTGRAFAIGIGELNPMVDILHATFGMAGIVGVKLFFLTLLFFLLPWVRSWTRALLTFVCSAYIALSFAHIWYLAKLH